MPKTQLCSIAKYITPICRWEKRDRERPQRSHKESQNSQRRSNATSYPPLPLASLRGRCSCDTGAGLSYECDIPIVLSSTESFRDEHLFSCSRKWLDVTRGITFSRQMTQSFILSQFQRIKSNRQIQISNSHCLNYQNTKNIFPFFL